MGAIIPARKQISEQVRGEGMEGCPEPELGKIRHLLVVLVLAEPRIRHVLVHVVVVLVVLVVALRPRPEGHEKRGVAQVSADGVHPRVVAERRVTAIMSCY